MILILYKKLKSYWFINHHHLYCQLKLYQSLSNSSSSHSYKLQLVLLAIRLSLYLTCPEQIFQMKLLLLLIPNRVVVTIAVIIIRRDKEIGYCVIVVPVELLVIQLQHQELELMVLVPLYQWTIEMQYQWHQQQKILVYNSKQFLVQLTLKVHQQIYQLLFLSQWWWLDLLLLKPIKHVNHHEFDIKYQLV